MQSKPTVNPNPFNIILQADYTIINGIVTTHWIADDPGAGMPSDYYVDYTVAEIASSTPAQLGAKASTTVRQNLRGTGIVISKIDGLVGSKVVI